VAQAPDAFRLIYDCPKALLAAQLENVPKLRVHLVALTIGQIKPHGEQLLRMSRLQDRKVQIAEKPPALEIAREQDIRHLLKEVFG
jgi:hypothetical protein